MAIAFVRFGGAILARGHPSDEANYFAGFARLAAGLDPYTLLEANLAPSLAAFGATLVAVTGERATALLLRILSVGGIGATAWLAAAATERPFRQRLALAGAAVVVAPPFAHAMSFGNIGAAAAGLALSALALASRRPVGAGTLLASSLLLKPVAGVLLPLLAFGHAGGHDEPRVVRSRITAGLAATAAALLALAAGPALVVRFLARHGEAWISPFQLGFVRTAGEVGVALPTWLPPLVVGAAGALWLRRRPRSVPLFAAVAPALALAASPIVWLHTLGLALPVQLRALLGPDAGCAGVRRPLELTLRAALAASIWGAGAVGAVAGAPPLVRAVVGALPLIAVLVLAARCVADEERRLR